jgi:hypothetical protein
MIQIRRDRTVWKRESEMVGFKIFMCPAAKFLKGTQPPIPQEWASKGGMLIDQDHSRPESYNRTTSIFCFMCFLYGSNRVNTKKIGQLSYSKFEQHLAG